MVPGRGGPACAHAGGGGDAEGEHRRALVAWAPQTCMVLVEQSQVWIGSEDSVIYIVSIHSMSCNKQLTDHRASVTDLVPDRTEAPRCRALREGAVGARAGRGPAGRQRAAGGAEPRALLSGLVSSAEQHSCPVRSGPGVRRVVSSGWHAAFRGFWWSGRGPRMQTPPPAPRLRVARCRAPPPSARARCRWP